MRPFVYNALPSRVIFGTGTLSEVPKEIRRLGCSRALVLTTPQQEKDGETLRSLIGAGLAVALYANATMHTPTEVTEDAMRVVKALDVDCLIALGGGSTIGLGKAIALRTDLPQIAVPTTYAGSEATPIIGQTENKQKTTQRTLKVLPEVIVYDVALTRTLPASMIITSGMNAIAHAVEALYSHERNPVIDSLAQQGIRSIASALPKLIRGKTNEDDMEARSDALYGAWACGTCLGAVGMGLHHKLCHILGGTSNLPHAATHTVVLPYALAYNAPYAQDPVAKRSYDLAKSLGAPCSLKELGMKGEDLDRAADLAVKSPYPNPAPLEKERLLVLLRNAWTENRPG